MKRADRLFLLVASREAPGKLLALLDSIEQTATDLEGVELLVYVDDDDELTLDLVQSGKLASRAVKVTPHVLPRPRVQGEIINRLSAMCLDRSGVLMGMPDDYLFGTLGWDERVREAYWATPDHISLSFPVDPTVVRGQVTFAFLSTVWVRTLGRFITDRFPFWFDDNWLDEVSQLVQRKFPLEVVMVTRGGRGKTRRMRNLPFWQNYYSCVFDERLADAEKLRAAIWGSDEDARRASRRVGTSRYRAFRLAAQHSDSTLLATESNLSANWGEDRALIPDSYWKAEGAAVAELRGKVDRYLAAGDVPRAMGMLATITRAYRPTPEAGGMLRELAGRYPKAFRGDIAETQYRTPHDGSLPPLTELPDEEGPRQSLAAADPTSRRLQSIDLLGQALEFMKRREFRLAEGLLRTATYLDETLPNLHHVHAVTLENLGSFREALRAAERELRVSPGNPESTRLLEKLRQRASG